MGDISKWSATAADNDDAALADGVDWRENMPARQVNNSARAEMADVRGAFEGPDSVDNGLEWWNSGLVPTRTGNATFTVPTDVTARFVEGRRLRLTDSATIYASVVSSSYSSVTTVTVKTDDGSNLSASLTKVYLSPQMPTNVSAPAIFNKNDYALTTGTASAYVASFTPKIPALTNGVRCRIRLHTTCDATPTFAPDGLTAKTIVKPGNVAVADDELTADSVLPLVYVAALDKWVIEGIPVTGAPDASETVKGIAELATQAETNTGSDDARIVTPLKLVTWFTARVQSLINMVDAILQRPELKDYSETVNAIGNTSTACTIDLELGNAVTATLNGNCTFTFSNPPASGRMGSFVLYLLNDGTGGRTTTWPAAVKWAGGSQPSRDTTANARNIYTFLTFDGGTTWFGSLGVRGAA